MTDPQAKDELPDTGLVRSAVSPKLLDFFQILDSFRSLPGLCVIVFVDRRVSSTLLASAIRKRESEETTLSPQYVPDILLGHGEHSKEGTWHFF